MSSFIHSILFQSQPGNEQTRKLRKPPREIKTFPKNNCKYMRLGRFYQVNFLKFLTELALASKFYFIVMAVWSAHSSKTFFFSFMKRRAFHACLGTFFSRMYQQRKSYRIQVTQ